eukprot:3162065-Prymnesium_polylepis.2
MIFSRAVAMAPELLLLRRRMGFGTKLAWPPPFTGVAAGPPAMQHPAPVAAVASLCVDDVDAPPEVAAPSPPQSSLLLRRSRVSKDGDGALLDGGWDCDASACWGRLFDGVVIERFGAIGLVFPLAVTPAGFAALSSSASADAASPRTSTSGPSPTSCAGCSHTLTSGAM